MTYVATNIQNDRVLVKLDTDRLDAANAVDVKAEILSTVKKSNSTRLIVDMGPVTFIDSSGLGALVSVRKNIPETWEMDLRNTTGFVQKVLKLTKMDRVFSI